MPGNIIFGRLDVRPCEIIMVALEIGYPVHGGCTYERLLFFLYRDVSVESLKFLSSRQAVRDLAEFIKGMKKVAFFKPTLEVSLVLVRRKP